MDNSVRPKSHPVWDVYDLQRSASLNVKYYSERLSRLQRIHFFMEITLAISAPSSAVAGLWLWDLPLGEIAWKFFGLIAAFIAILKPLLRLTEKIRQCEESLVGYRSLFHDLETLGILIRERGSYDAELRRLFHEALKKKGHLSQKDVTIKVDKKLRARCQKEVLRELPAKAFFLPSTIQ